MGNAPLSLTALPKVEYCIPLWLRDQQVKAATSRIHARITPGPVTDTPCAIACFGPSLADTWAQVRDYPVRITCSGAHKFLIDRGVIPTYHVEVDPRPHKVQLIGPPHPDVTYVIASTCHPDVFDHLAGQTIVLWHVFSNEADALRVLPPGEWALTGGSSVGLRAMTISRFFGYTQQHIFGMDGCEGPTGKHAGAHPNQPPGKKPIEYDGVTYYTTESMLVCAHGTWHELNEMPDVTATFYGEGLVQAMARHYVKAPSQAATLGYVKPALISAAYVEQNARLHADNLAYGVGGGKHAPTVAKLKASCQAESVLDYGAGKGLLAQALPFPIWEYDPAIPEKAASPRPADLVVCTDVLEHVEPEHLGDVLADLRRCTRKVGYFVIHTGPAGKCLPDGRNTHLIQQGQDWWARELGQYFQIGQIVQKGPQIYAVVGPKAGRRPKHTASVLRVGAPA